jgi:hypothetical protein
MHRESDHWLKRTNRAIRDEILNPDTLLVPVAVAPPAPK